MSVTITDQSNTVTVNESTLNLTITDGTGPVGPTGATGAPGYHGAFYSTQTQTNPSGTATNLMTFNATSSASGVAIANSSRITVTYAGVYNLAFSAQMDKTDSGSDDVEIWLVHNGNQVEWSNTKLTLPSNGSKVVAAWNWMIELAAADWVAIGWYSADTSMRILAQAASTNPVRPAIPSVIATLNQVQNPTS